MKTEISFLHANISATTDFARFTTNVRDYAENIRRKNYPFMPKCPTVAGIKSLKNLSPII